MLKRFCIFSIALFMLNSVCGQDTIWHTVKKGDVISNIAGTNKTTIDSIKKWNGLKDVNSISIGQQLIVGIQYHERQSGEGDNHNDENVAETTKTEVVSDSGDAKGIVRPSVEASPNTKQSEKKQDGANSNGVKDKSFSWGTLLIGSLLGAVLGIILFYLMYVKKSKTEYENYKKELNQKNARLLDEKRDLKKEISGLKEKKQTLEREKQKLFDENVALGEQLDQLKVLLKQEKEEKERNTEGVSSNQILRQTSSPTVLYADAIIDDYFVKTTEIPDEDSIFMLSLNGDESAVFSIYKPAYQKVVSNLSFLEGCEKQIIGDSMLLEIVSEGRAQKEMSNGKWKVVGKLKIIIK